MKKSIFWEKRLYQVNIDLTGKGSGDSVPSPISAGELIARMPFKLPVLCAKINSDITACFTSFYCKGEDGLSQVVFITNLEAEGETIKYLILSDSEFTIIGG